jgi:hypothetical protein
LSHDNLAHETIEASEGSITIRETAKPARFVRVIRVVTAIPLVAVLSGLALSPTSAQAVTAREQIEQGFYSRSTDWDQDVVHEFTDSILDLCARRNKVLSETEIESISNGIATVPYVDVITDISHPLRKERSKQRLLYAVDNYVQLGAGDQQQRKQFLAQAESCLSRFTEELVQTFPDRGVTVSGSTTRVLGWLKDWADNPLRRDYKKPFTEAQLAALDASWRHKLNSLKEDIKRQESDSEFEPAFQGKVTSLSLEVFAQHANLTRLPELPMPESLTKAEEELTRNISTVSSWEQQRGDEKRAAERQARRHKQFLKGLKIDDQFYLDQIPNVAVVEASKNRHSVPNAVTDAPSKAPKPSDVQHVQAQTKEADRAQENGSQPSGEPPERFLLRKYWLIGLVLLLLSISIIGYLQRAAGHT